MFKFPEIQPENASIRHEHLSERMISRTLTNVVSRRFSHPDVRSFLQPQSNFEYILHPALEMGAEK